MRRVLSLFGAAAMTSAAMAQNPFISEMFVDPFAGPSDDGREFIEIMHTPNFSLAGYYFLVIEGDNTGGSNSGVVDQVINLGSYTTGSNGLLLIRDSANVLLPAPSGGTNVVVFNFTPDIENGSNTYILGFGTPPTLGADLDTDGDGTLNPGALAGFTVVDAVAYKDSVADAGSDDEYADDVGGTNLGAFTGFSPDAIYRVLDCSFRPLIWAGGDTQTPAPPNDIVGPFNWRAGFTFGWNTVGITDPENRSLDPGTVNYVSGNCVGRCCLANGFCQVVSESACLTAGGSYGGNGTNCSPNTCPGPLGACCFPNDGSCQELTNGQCVDAGGNFQGNGSTCAMTSCPQPLGACCLAGGVCAQFTNADCTTMGGTWVGALTACFADRCPQDANSNDLALGLSTNANRTAEQVRGGARVGRWNKFDFHQSMEFDNSGGILHNANGNLLTMNFGAGGGTPGSGPTCSDPMRPGEAAKVYNLATNGDDEGQLLYDFNSLAGGIECTRAGGLSVSPDNTKLAMIGNDTGSLIVLNYNAGTMVGTGSGASVTGAHVYPFFTFTAVTQGTTWYDNTDILSYIPDPFGDPAVIVLDVTRFSAGTFTPVRQVVVTLPSGDTFTGSRFTDVEYNPGVAPYIFCHASAFASNVTKNWLTIINPATWTVVRTIKLYDLVNGNSLNTGREIALGPDRRLYLGQFNAGGTGPVVDYLTLDTDADNDVDAIDIAALPDNSTVNYYTTGTSASFNGLDVGFKNADPCDGTLCGDSNCDGAVNILDINYFVAAVQGLAQWDALPGTDCNFCCANDVNHDGLVNILDINAFVAAVGAGGCGPGMSGPPCLGN